MDCCCSLSHVVSPLSLSESILLAAAASVTRSDPVESAAPVPSGKSLTVTHSSPERVSFDCLLPLSDLCCGVGVGACIGAFALTVSESDSDSRIDSIRFRLDRPLSGCG